MPQQRDVSLEFMGALSLPTAPWRTRAAWWLLLTLLRIPGAARLLQWFRSRA